MAELNDHFARANEAALKGDFDVAFRDFLTGLHEIYDEKGNRFDVFGFPRNHFKVDWQRVNDVVKEACNPKYPWEYGLATLRYTCIFDEYLSDWNLIIDEMCVRLKANKQDPERLMRGLID